MTQAELANFAGVKPVQETYPINEKLTQETYPISKKPIRKTAQAILDFLMQNPHATRTQVAVAVGKTEDTVKFHIGNLQKSGIIERVGSNKNGHWKIVLPSDHCPVELTIQ